MKTAVIDVGGGMRDVYGSGVFDFCLDNGIGFDYCIGISAGSANISSYLAGQKGARSRRFYDVYSFRKAVHEFRKLCPPRIICRSRLCLRGSYESRRRRPARL